jgi:hypothetical protein
MSARHPGLTEIVAADYLEAARVCLDRHHTPPVNFNVENHGTSVRVVVEWEVTNDRERSARASYRETTEKGAYGCSLAAVEMTENLVAVRRADVPAGADYYIAPVGTELDDLEDALRLEVSGVDKGNRTEVRLRLRRKLDQAARGKSNLPAMAGIVGFNEKTIMLERVEIT